MDATITVTGNVGSDIDLRTGPNGEWAYAAFRLASTPRLLRNGQNVPLVDWAAQVLDECVPLAAALDATHASGDYSAALANARALLAQPGQTPSARVLAQMAQAHDNSFTAFTLSQSSQAREALLELPWSAEQQARHAALAAQSLVSQKAIEDSDTQPFEEWRQQYMAAQGLG